MAYKPVSHIFFMETLQSGKTTSVDPDQTWEIVWLYPFGVPIFLIIHPHLFCMKSMAIRQINQCRSDLRMYQY